MTSTARALLLLVAGALACAGQRSQPTSAAALERAPAPPTHLPPGCPLRDAEDFRLWPGTPPESTSAPTEQLSERSRDPALHDRSIKGVSTPALRAYRSGQPNGAAALVFPGGGYHHLSWDKEGTDIAEWLGTLGVAAFVVKYRLPHDFPDSPSVALADAQRALRSVRHHAAACAIDPARIGVIGFSAGGHLASQLATRSSAELVPARDDIDRADARPDFAVLVYPVISMDPAITHAGSRAALLGSSPTEADVALASSDLQVTRQTPPTFLAVSRLDASVSPQNSARFAQALATHGVAHEQHLYQDGAHGTGIRNATGDMAAWPKQCASWLAASRFFGP